MRVAASMLGLGAMTYSTVPPSAGVSIDTARRACAIAKGTWDDDAGGCRVPDYSAPPDWCSWVPFSGMMDACKLPTPGDLTVESAFTAYKIGQMPSAACQPTFQNGQMVPPAPGCTTTGVDAAETIISASSQQSQRLVSDLGCEYDTALNHPWLTQLVGPSIACGLTNPFDTQHYGWVMYLVAGVGLFLAVSALRGR